MTKIACFATHVKSIYIGFGETSLDSRTWFNVVKMFPQSKRIDTEFEYFNFAPYILLYILSLQFFTAFTIQLKILN